MKEAKFFSDYEPTTSLRIIQTDDGDIVLSIHGSGEMRVATSGGKLHGQALATCIEGFRMIMAALNGEDAEPETQPAIPEHEVPEFVGQIVDIFEDFLEERGVSLDNPEKDEAVSDGSDPEEIAIIYGTDYGELQTKIEETLTGWGLTTPAGSV